MTCVLDFRCTRLHQTVFEEEITGRKGPRERAKSVNMAGVGWGYVISICWEGCDGARATQESGARCRGVEVLVERRHI